MIDSLPYYLRRKALERLKDPYLGLFRTKIYDTNTPYLLYLIRKYTAKLAYNLREKIMDRYADIDRDMLLQVKFNKKKLPNYNITKLLIIIYNEQLYLTKFPSKYQGINSHCIMSALYTDKWLDHPDGKTIKADIENLLDGLADRGELNRDPNGRYYTIAEKNLKAIMIVWRRERFRFLIGQGI